MKVARYLLPLTFATLVGCVVPAGPSWVDPQANVPPSIASATPPVGSVLGADGEGGTQLTVEVVLADQNTKDTLYVHWLVDYPPNVDGVSRLALPQSIPGNDRIERAPIAFAPSCSDIVRNVTNHRLLLAVSDRHFADDRDLTSGGYLLEASWPFNLNCQ